MKNKKSIKIEVNMFGNNKIKLIETYEKRDLILAIWLKLLTEAGMRNDRGLIYLTKDKGYDKKMLPIVFNRNIEDIEYSFDKLSELNMISIDENGVIEVVSWCEYQESKPKDTPNAAGSGANLKNQVVEDEKEEILDENEIIEARKEEECIENTPTNGVDSEIKVKANTTVAENNEGKEINSENISTPVTSSSIANLIETKRRKSGSGIRTKKVQDDPNNFHLCDDLYNEDEDEDEEENAGFSSGEPVIPPDQTLVRHFDFTTPNNTD